jgi:hypothetical protein
VEIYKSTMKRITRLLYPGIALFMLCNGLFAQEGEPILKVYSDFMKKDALQSTIAFFISYQQEKYRLSYEFITVFNSRLTLGGIVK